VVILGNVVSGKLIRMSYRMDIVAAAWNEARRIRPDGWEQLLVSHKEGYGAALCLRTPAGVRFFVAHGARSQAEAVREAQDRANAALAALKVADKPVACAAPWLVEPGRTDTLEPEDPDLVDDLIDDARKAIRDWVACPPGEGQERIRPTRRRRQRLREARGSACGRRARLTLPIGLRPAVRISRPVAICDPIGPGTLIDARGDGRRRALRDDHPAPDHTTGTSKQTVAAILAG
jgi:hypothetical protein